MTFVRRFSYLLVILPLLVVGCGRQPLLGEGGTGGIGDTPSTDGEKPRGIDPDRDGDGDNNNGDGDQGGADGDDGDSNDPPTPDRPSRPPQTLPPAPTPIPQQCVDKCEIVANDIFQSCLMQNNSKQSCWDQRQKYYNECVFSNCGGMSDPGEPSPLPTISCEDQCVVGSAAEFIGCVQSGRPLEFCAVIAQGNVDGCQRGCNGEGSISCEESCEQETSASFNACLTSGVPARRCEQFQRQQFRDCSQRCR